MKKEYVALLLVSCFLAVSVGLILVGQDIRSSHQIRTGKTDTLSDETWYDVVEKIQEREEVVCTYGTLPDLTDETHRRAWISRLQAYTTVQKKEMMPYLYPDGPILSLGYDVQGYVKVMVRENYTASENETGVWYRILKLYGEKRGIKDIPVKIVVTSDRTPEINIPVTLQTP
ncbi:hypothetical protein E2N92_06780 [Methanofollis formosanus]|uniref:Uncharacterized protein n=1 Tax=Methanofollis formosanus TaxID=299308 RepID=A0A8G1EGP9_9EURY|nr:hypothetical protein [Methanofollis formosanus]QYZ79157.1 hypothetical protein E2N92_06780 [Methanofollis formosanus]